MIALVLITALAGVGFAFAAPPWSVFGLAWCSWIPLWWGVEQSREQGLSPLNRSLLGLVWGLAYYGLSLHWITGLHPLMWMGLSWGSSIAVALGAWLFLTLWNTAPIVLWMLILGGCSLRWQWTRSQQLAMGVALSCSLDWIWSHLPIYSGSLAITQSPGNLWLLYCTRWVGPLGISAAIVLVNGLLAYGLRAALQSTTQKTPQARTWWSLALGLLIALQGIGWLTGQGVGNREQGTEVRNQGIGIRGQGAGSPPFTQNSKLKTQNSSPSITLGLIQGNVPTRIKLTPAGIEQSLKVYRQGYEALASLGVDAVLMPEGAIPLVWEGRTRSQSGLYQSIRRLGTPAWLSTFLSADSSEKTGLTQSLIAVDATGSVTSRYNKVKLVPFGEYIPLEKLLSTVIRRLSLMEGSLVPGETGQSFQTPWGQAAIGICYEPLFPSVLQDQVKRGAAFILIASNLDPYDTRLMAYQEALNVMRAIENDRWLVAVSNTGYSSLINPLGQVLWRSSPQQLVIAPVELYPRYTHTLYSQTGDGLLLAGLWGWAMGQILWGNGSKMKHQD